jgi:hypothetical protein
MIRRSVACLLFASLFPVMAWAHLGSPDVFFDGDIGPYPAHVAIRMPAVVPGRAEISVQLQTNEPAIVSFLPLFSRTAVSNAPPPDLGQPVRGEPNLYSGDLWLMTFGAYSIQVNVHGSRGDGSIQIPVTSVAISQLPLPPWLGAALLALGGLLIFGGLAIVAGAARDGDLPPGAVPGKAGRRRGFYAGGAALVIFVLAAVGGKHWWALDEANFRQRLRGGAWPDLDLAARIDGSQRILELTLGRRDLGPEERVSLLPDHGKILHLFLIQEGGADVIAHVHPVRKSDKTFQVALPPLAAGRYKVFCDLTLEGSGMSFTATNSVQLPAPLAARAGAVSLEPDPDDSWASYAEAGIPTAASTNVVYVSPGGQRVAWKAHAPLRARKDAGLQFDVQDSDGKPVPLEPYMGMMSHAAVMRRDGSVFDHLHPSGNFSMAAQGYFADKMAHEAGATDDAMASMPGMAGMAGMDHSMPTTGPSLITLPYEFPLPGDYRIWVQYKTAGRVQTAVFDAKVQP